MKRKSKLVNVNDLTNLVRMAYVSKRLNTYGKNLHLNQNDLDCLRLIFNGYMKIIERVNNYELEK